MLRMDSERSSMIMVQLLCVDNGLIVAMQSALVVSFFFACLGDIDWLLVVWRMNRAKMR